MTSTPRIGLEKSILIDAPIDRVFTFYANPENLPEVWPSMIEVKDVERAEDGHARSFKWVYKMVGMRFEGSSVVTTHEKDRRITTENKGGIESTFDAFFEDHDGKTLLREHVQYHVPVPLLGRVADRFLAKSNEHELETIHKNLKARLESESST